MGIFTSDPNSVEYLGMYVLGTVHERQEVITTLPDDHARQSTYVIRELNGWIFTIVEYRYIAEPGEVISI